MKNRLFEIAIVLLIITSARVLCQEKITHDKRIYVSPDGKTYIQKDLPIYLRIATSPNKEDDSHLLQSEETKAYANPFYLDTEGYNTIRTPSCVDTVTKKAIYPLRDVIFEIYSDATPPKTKAEYGEGKLFHKDNKVYTSGNLMLEFDAKDAISGVNKIYYSIDGAAYKVFSSAIALNDEKEYAIKYYSIDNVGNDEEVQIVNIVVDGSKPVTKIEFEGDQKDNIVSGNTKIKFSSEDKNGVQNIFYTLDANPQKVYKYPLQTKYLSEGEHKITFHSVDNVKNEEAEKEYVFYVDKTPPTIVQEILGNSIIANGQEYSSGRSKLKLTTFDNKAGVKEVFYSVNGGEYEKYDKPFYLSSASGKLNIKAYALDFVNNKSSEDQEVSKGSLPYIDLSGPVIKNRFKGSVFVARDTVFINKNTEVILQATDNEAGINAITYSIDGGTIESYDKPFSISKEGLHKISYTATDKVDNTNSEDFQVFVDNKGPEVFERFSTQAVKKEEGREVHPSYVVLFVSATDVIVGLDKMIYFMNGSKTPVPYDGYISGFTRDKVYDILFKAFDNLGNETEHTINFKTDTF